MTQQRRYNPSRAMTNSTLDSKGLATKAGLWPTRLTIANDFLWDLAATACEQSCVGEQGNMQYAKSRRALQGHESLPSGMYSGTASFTTATSSTMPILEIWCKPVCPTVAKTQDASTIKQASQCHTEFTKVYKQTGAKTQSDPCIRNLA